MSDLTVLIPAYNKEYLGDVFKGISNQSFQDFNIILSDDSENGEITQLLNNGYYEKFFSRNLKIQVIRGPLNGRQNHERLLAQWGGSTPFVHFHLDDDIIYPEFYNKHVKAHKSGDYLVTVTPRWIADISGQPISAREIPQIINESTFQNTVVDRKFMMDTVVPSCNNWLGEFTNMVFSTKGAMFFPKPPEKGLSFYGLMDIGMLLNASENGNILFINAYQSIFRQHPMQSTKNTKSHGGKVAHYCWITYALNAWKKGYISKKEACEALKKIKYEIIKSLGIDESNSQLLNLINDDSIELNNFYSLYEVFWSSLLKSHPSTARSSVWI
jgi:glycosyltransferase involved in cell wall biosynthesis